MNDEVEITELGEPQQAPEKVESKQTEGVDVTPLKNFLYGSRNNDISQEDGEKMAFVWDFYSQRATGPGVALGMISDLEKSLAIPPEGVSRIEHLYSYVLLMSQQRDIEHELAAYRRY